MDLWMVNADGSSPHPLTKNGGMNLDPEWHSNNTIYFTSSVGRKGFGLSRISATVGKPVPALAPDQRAIEPSSSPDGEHIVFVRPGRRIWEQNVPDGKPRRLLQEETLWQARPTESRKI
jgi:Tol biopolymer transport system component